MDTPSTLETLHARMTAAKLTSDVDPLSRISAVLSDDLHTVAAHSQLERMLQALQPLNVARETVGTWPGAPSERPARTARRFRPPAAWARDSSGMGELEPAEQRPLGRARWRQADPHVETGTRRRAMRC